MQQLGSATGGAFGGSCTAAFGIKSAYGPFICAPGHHLALSQECNPLCLRWSLAARGPGTLSVVVITGTLDLVGRGPIDHTVQPCVNGVLEDGTRGWNTMALLHWLVGCALPRQHGRLCKFRRADNEQIGCFHCALTASGSVVLSAMGWGCGSDTL